jgi:hypothetical protein
VWFVEDVFQTSEKHCVVRGRGALRDSATEFLAESAVLDDEALGEAIGLSSLTDDLVQREDVARLEQRAIDQGSGAANVDVAVRKIGKVGRELTRDPLNAKLLRIRGGERCLGAVS